MDVDRFRVVSPTGEPYDLEDVYAAYAEGERGATNVQEALASVRKIGGTSVLAVVASLVVVFALALVEVLAGRV